jgi:hypothetical protein
MQLGDTVKISDVDGFLVLMPMVPLVPELAREIERVRSAAGLNVEGMLAALREQREVSQTSALFTRLRGI